MTARSETPAHALTAEEFAARVGVEPASGLSAAEVSARLKLYGPNRLARRRPRGALAILVDQFRSLIVLLLTAAVALALFVGDHPEAIAIAAVLALNAAIGFVTEFRATRSMEALRRIGEVSTRVRRHQGVAMVDARKLVPGDVVLLEAGDVITADLRLIEAADLWCDESVLTGESMPVAKSAGPLPDATALADRANMAFKGAAITRGTGAALVAATGMATELGRISQLAETAEASASPLEKRLEALGQRLAVLTLALAAATVAAGIARGLPVTPMIETGIALAVAAVPEGLPIVATLCLARGMWRMAARNALITRLSAVETLGATTMILTDKTGTLTENRMTLTVMLLDAGDIAPDGTASAAMVRALTAGVLCNNAALDDSGGTGDPMELALLQAGHVARLDRPALLAARPEVAEHAFSSDHNMMATVHRDDGAALFAVKGAPEAVLPCCSHVATNSGPRPMDDPAHARWAARIDAAAASGARLLALADKTVADPDEAPYRGLTLLGVACLSDPLRADVAAAIADARAAGVRVVMMTGDHARTAEEIGRRAGICAGTDCALTGAEIGQIDTLDADGRQRLLEAEVFARVAPETKVQLVAMYQNSGEVVAMTGDGVNDAPALKKADIGIAMGKRGTDVAREAAHMVLKDDAFSTIVIAMREGRIIFDNIRRFVVYLMSCNVSEVLIVALAVGAGLPSPLLPLQILFLNLVTDVFPAFALGLGPGAAGIMRQPPRDPAEAIVERRHWAAIAALGGLITAAVLGAFVLALNNPLYDLDQAITIAFLALALAQLWNVFNLRSVRGGVFVNNITSNGWVWAALALCLGLLAAALWHPVLAPVLGLKSPGIGGLQLALAASLVPIGVWQTGLLIADWRARSFAAGETVQTG